MVVAAIRSRGLPPGESAGPQQRDAAEGAVIATLLHDPDLLIVYEPSLPRPGQHPVVKDIIENAERGMTIIMSTHQMQPRWKRCATASCSSTGTGGALWQVDSIKHDFAATPSPLKDTATSRNCPASWKFVTRTTTTWNLTLEPGANPQNVLRALLNHPTSRWTLEIAEPSLEDIFVTVVQSHKEKTMHKLWLVARFEYNQIVKKVVPGACWVPRADCGGDVISIFVALGQRGAHPIGYVDYTLLSPPSSPCWKKAKNTPRWCLP
jgi:hypothetical protein